MSNFNELKTKKARTAYIKEMLGTNKAWAIRGLLRIYDNQTQDEQRSKDTRHWNKIGFTGADAYILTSFAQQVLENNFVGSKKQMGIVFSRMPKYAGQLEKMSTPKPS